MCESISEDRFKHLKNILSTLYTNAEEKKIIKDLLDNHGDDPLDLLQTIALRLKEHGHTQQADELEQQLTGFKGALKKCEQIQLKPIEPCADASNYQLDLPLTPANLVAIDLDYDWYEGQHILINRFHLFKVTSQAEHGLHMVKCCCYTKDLAYVPPAILVEMIEMGKFKWLYNILVRPQLNVAEFTGQINELQKTEHRKLHQEELTIISNIIDEIQKCCKLCAKIVDVKSKRMTSLSTLEEMVHNLHDVIDKGYAYLSTAIKDDFQQLISEGETLLNKMKNDVRNKSTHYDTLKAVFVEMDIKLAFFNERLELIYNKLEECTHCAQDQFLLETVIYDTNE